MDANVLNVGAEASGAAIAWRLAASVLNVTCLEQRAFVSCDNVPALDRDWERARTPASRPNRNLRRRPAAYPAAHEGSPITPLMFNGVGAAPGGCPATGTSDQHRDKDRAAP